MLKQINIIHYERSMTVETLRKYQDAMLVMTTGWKMDADITYTGNPIESVIIKEVENN